MANALTPKVRGIKQSVKMTIIQEMVNTKKKINSLPISEDAEPFFEIRDNLRDELIRLSEQSITDLNDSPALGNIVAELDAAAKKAKQTANSLKALTRKINGFTEVVGRIEGIVSKIIDLAV